MRIRPASKRQEKRLLAAMLAELNEPPDNSFKARIRRELANIVVAVMLVVVVFAVLYAQSWLAVFISIGGVVLGLAVNAVSHRIETARQWPIVSGCLDRDKIERRLHELDA